MHSFRSLAAPLALCSLAALALPGQAQTPAPAPAQTAPAQPSPAQASPPPAPAAPAPAAPVEVPTPPAPIAPPAAETPLPLDLMPLKKALHPLAASRLLQSQSKFSMTGSKQGLSFTFRQEARIIAKKPGRFRAELTQFSTENVPQQRLTVISNGVKVWTYRPGTRQYSVTSYKAFQAANNDVTALGLAIGGFFLGDGHELAQGFQGLTKDNSAEVLAALTGMGITLSSKAQSIANEDDLVYRMELTKQGLVYQFMVDSASGALRRVELTGAQKGIQVAFHEEIAQLTPLTSVPNDTFTFTPPPGTAKVAALSVDPF